MLNISAYATATVQRSHTSTDVFWTGAKRQIEWVHMTHYVTPHCGFSHCWITSLGEWPCAFRLCFYKSWLRLNFFGTHYCSPNRLPSIKWMGKPAFFSDAMLQPMWIFEPHSKCTVVFFLFVTPARCDTGGVAKSLKLEICFCKCSG